MNVNADVNGELVREMHGRIVARASAQAPSPFCCCGSSLVFGVEKLFYSCMHCEAARYFGDWYRARAKTFSTPTHGTERNKHMAAGIIRQLCLLCAR